MNEDESILAEVRKISAYADMQRKITKWSLIFVAAFVPALIIFAIVMENRLHDTLTDVSSPAKAEKSTWTDVDWKIRIGDLDDAIRIGEALIQKTPQYPEGHHRLASAYLAAGKPAQAREHYAQAFQLFPTEENEKLLIAIDRRIKQGPPQNGAPNGSQPLRSETNQTPSAAGPRR